MPPTTKKATATAVRLFRHFSGAESAHFDIRRGDENDYLGLSLRLDHDRYTGEPTLLTEGTIKLGVAERRDNARRTLVGAQITLTPIEARRLARALNKMADLKDGRQTAVIE